MQLNRVEQEHDTGCGLACLSMLSGGKFTYEEVMRLVYPEDEYDYEDDDFYTNNRQIKAALTEMGIRYYERFRTVSADWSVAVQKIQGLAMVACGTREEKYWHWVVFDSVSGLVYDPDKTKPKPYKPNNRYKRPIRYMTIYP